MNVQFRPETRTNFRTAYARSWSTEAALSKIVYTIGKSNPTTMLLFCGGKHRPDKVFHGLRLAYPRTPIVGGSAAGVITHDGLGCSGLEIGALAMFGLDTTPAIVTAYGLDRSEAATGFELGEKIAALASTDAPVFLFYDSVAAANPHRLHPAASLLSGLQTALRGHKVRLVGGGTLTDLNLNDGWVFDGESVRKHAAIALVFPPQASMATTVVHGCRPASAFMEVTKIEGAKVFELDGRPALTVIEEMLGLPIGGTTGQDLSLVATLGQKLGDPYAPYDENAYVNRLILNADRSDGSITLFEPDFSKGARVQIMSRDNEMMLQSAMAGAEQARRAVAMHNENAAFCLYIDCAGRASARSGARVEEADIVKRGLPPDLPFLGFYSGVEIAPIGGQVRALDWTGVIATVHHGHAG